MHIPIQIVKECGDACVPWNWLPKATSAKEDFNSEVKSSESLYLAIHVLELEPIQWVHK